MVLMRLRASVGAALVPFVAAGVWACASLAASSGSAAGAHGTPAGGENARVASSTQPAGPAVNGFGYALMPKLGGGNVVYSPDSIAVALAMAGKGAAGETAKQMAHVLKLSSPAGFDEIGQLQNTISAEQKTAASGDSQGAPTLEIANGLFIDKGFSLRSPFLTSLKTDFGVLPQSVEFGGGGSSALQAINGWVSEHTHGLIPAILQTVPPETVLALANAIYLKAGWANPFSASATSPATFHGLHKAASMAFMHETDELAYSHGTGYAAVELPYRASTLSLLVVLPVGQSIVSLQKKLNGAELAKIGNGLTTQRVALSLPRFKLEFHRELKPALEELGMTEAFSEGADFSGMAAQPVKIGVVEHAANFSIDEQGTLAAAATVVGVETTAIAAPVEPPVQFNANRPFLFFLRDEHTGTILFAGRFRGTGRLTTSALTIGVGPLGYASGPTIRSPLRRRRWTWTLLRPASHRWRSADMAPEV